MKDDQMSRTVWLQCVATLIALFQTGCSTLPFPSHIHNEASAVAARQARETMAEYSKNAPQMYSTMLQNVDVFKVEEDMLISQLAANESTALVTQLPSMTNDDFQKRIHDQLDEAELVKKKLGGAAKKALNNLHVDTAEVSSLQQAVKKAQGNVVKEKENVSAWNMNVALLQVSLTQLPTDALQAPTPENLKDLAKKVSQQQVTYIDADGKSQSTTVGKILQKNANSVDDLSSNSGALIDKLPHAPGLGVVVANLGLDFARIEQKRVQLRLEQARSLLVSLQDANAQVETALHLLKQANRYPVSRSALQNQLLEVLLELASGNDSALKSAPVPETVSSNLRQGRPKPLQAVQVAAADEGKSRTLTELGRRKRLTGLLFALRYEAIAESIISRVTNSYALAFARLEHIASIQDSELNDQEYQALIRSGLNGLVAYHEGGLTAQDVANVIAFGQAVAVGVLAGRVN